MSLENRRNGFREWGLLTVTHETTINGYIESLEVDLPEHLNIPSIFNITDIDEIDILYSRCSREGDLFQFSRNIGNGRPLAALGKYKTYLQYSFIKKVMHKYITNPNHFETNGANQYFKISGSDEQYPIKAICREALSILKLSSDFTTNQAKAALKKIFPKNTMSFIDRRENGGENFYGLWTPRNNQDKIDKCLDSGIWYRGDGDFNREEEARKIASMSEGDNIFLYYPSEDVKVADSPFAPYLPHEYLALGYTVVKAKCVGIGKVVSTNIEDLSVTVDWDEDYQGSEWYLYTRQDGVWWFDGKTQNKYKAQALYDIIFNGKEQDYKWWAENGGFNVDNITEQKANTNNKIKNIILYGSPGVGKTHNTNKLISLIESGISEKEIFETIKNNDPNNGVNIDNIKERVKFITFHQSFGYEDFIEGFRPNEDANIELEDGIFKRIAIQANENLLKSNTNQTILFNDAINLLLKEKIENEELVNINMKSENSYFSIYDYNDKTLYFEKKNGGRSHTLSLRILEQMYNAEENSIIHGGLAPYYNPLLEELLVIKRNAIQEQVERKNYYLVIDEINCQVLS